VGTTSQPPLRGGSGALRRLDARALAGLFRIALVPALRVLCQDVSPLHARASTLCRSSPAVRALLALRLLSEAESALPVTMGTLASSLSQSRRPAYLMVTADSSRSSQLLLLLTVR
jgi:hypothetical protein